MAKLTRKNIKLIGVASIGVIAIAGFFVVVSPLISQQSIQATERSDAQERIIKLQDQLAGVATVENNYQAVKAVNDKLAAQFPSLASVPNLLNAVSTAAANAGIPADAITGLTFSTPALVESAQPAAPAAGSGDAANSGGGEELDAAGEKAVTDSAGSGPSKTVTSDKLASMDVQLTVSGTPRQFEKFLDNLASMDRVVIITGAGISGSSGSGSSATPGGGSLSLQAKTYLYERILSPEERASDGTSPAGSVPASPSPEDVTTP